MSLEPTVFIVDDDPAILEMLMAACREIGLRAMSFTSGKAFLASVSANDPGCLVLDYRMPDMTGLDILDALEKAGIPLPVIFISGQAEVSTAIHAFKAGSLDFLEKPFQISQFSAAVKKAIETDRDTRAKQSNLKTVQTLEISLTPREREVMNLVVDGSANKQVASSLGVSPKTVEVHRANVMRKMQAKSLAELVKMSVLLRS